MTVRLRGRWAAAGGIVALAMFASRDARTASRASGDDQAPAAAPEESGSPPPAATIEPAPPPSNRTVWPWVIMGTGVGLVVTAIVLEVTSFAEDKKREDEEVRLTALPAGSPERQPLESSIQSHESSASHQRTAALVVGGIGFVAIAGSVVLWFYEGRSPAPPASARLKPSFSPAVTPSYAGASFGASF